MSTTEAPFSFTTKVRGDLLTVRGESVDEFASRLVELASHPQALDAITDLQALGGTATAVTTVKESIPGATVVETTSNKQPYEKNDKYGAVYTYNLAEAPDLPDGRGKYIKKVWTDKSGKARKAWVDPIKGPDPATPGAAEAPIVWI